MASTTRLRQRVSRQRGTPLFATSGLNRSGVELIAFTQQAIGCAIPTPTSEWNFPDVARIGRLSSLDDEVPPKKSCRLRESGSLGT